MRSTTLVGLILIGLALWLTFNPPGPGPGPLPPGPNPPAPIQGLRVLMVYESSSNMTQGQMAVLYSPKVADYLDAKCKDGKAGWRRYDKDFDAHGEPQIWQQIWADVKPKIKAVPALVVIDGTKGEALPLPETVDAALALLKKYGG